MDNITENILTKDSLAESERILGKTHYSEFNDFENGFAFSKLIYDNKKKTNHLKSIGDTHWGMKWNEFKDLIRKHGFVVGLEYDFKYESGTEEAIIYYHPTKGLIIFTTSYGQKDSINGGNLYGEIKANSEEDCQTVWRWMSTGGYIKDSDMVYETSHDVREGLFAKLDTLETAGKFLNKWINKDRFLWFADYAETKIDGYDYKKITQSKIEKLPQECRDIIGK